MGISKKRVGLIGLLIIAMLLNTNCFGKFALVKKVYEFHEGIKVSDSNEKLNGVVRSSLLWLFWMTPLLAFNPYAWAYVGDFFIANLLEFWNGENPIGYNEYDKNGTYVRVFENENEKLKLTYSNFGERLDVDFINNQSLNTIVFLRNQPGKIFLPYENSLKEISIEESKVEDKIVLKMLQNGRVKSSAIVQFKDYNQFLTDTSRRF
ncbi:MAG: DUF3332 family protein [Leptospiraceae bacterium]|nr:DUF3332 family protein [Leptospiraceae bacterium]